MTPKRLLPLVLAMLASAWLSGCREPGVPALTALRFDGTAEDSPVVLLMSVDFVDDDGDLSEGDLETFINGQPTSVGELPLLPLFLRSSLEADATDGTVGFVLELAFKDELPPSGASFALGARVEDGAGNTSGLQEIRLSLQHD